MRLYGLARDEYIYWPMDNGNDYRRARHGVFTMHVHLVFVTKYRRHVFTAAMLDDMRGIFAAVCAAFEADLIEMDGEDDHVHLLVNTRPRWRYRPS